MKNKLTEMKNTLQGIYSGVAKADNKIRYLEDKVTENTQSKQQKEKKSEKMRIV